MKIGIDLDTTLIKLSCIEIASEELGYEFKEQDNLDWNLTSFPENLRQRVYQMFSDPEFMCDKVSPIEGTQNKIKEWADKNYEMILITARVENIRSETIKMIHRLYPEIKDINFVGINESKQKIMIDKKINCWIDDSHMGTKDSLEAGIDTWLISNKHTRYNWHMRDKVKWVKAIKDIQI